MSVSRAKARNRKVPKEKLTIKGFVRFELVNIKTGEKRRSRWYKNIITADGFQNYIVGSIGNIAGAKNVTHLQVATQTAAPLSSQTSASGEFESRKTTSNSFISPGTFQATMSFNTNEATQSTMGAVALYNTSAGGTAASIATFATSNKTTDQTMAITYQWRFS
jgi:hypothetical protein